MRGARSGVIAVAVSLGIVAAGAYLFGPAAIKRVTRAYLVENPEILVDAIEALRERQGRQAAERQQLALAEFSDVVRFDPDSPVGGNPQGDVTVVEFFDYKCEFCRQYGPIKNALVAADPGVRFVYKELPVLGAESVLAARAAIAAAMQDPALYIAFHDALMQTVGALDEETLFQIAAEVGLDPDFLALNMADPAVDQMIDANYALAAALGVDATPSIVIGDAVVPGFIDLGETLRLVGLAREECRTC